MTTPNDRLAAAFMETHPEEAAQVIDSLPPPVAAALLGMSPPRTAAATLSSLSPGAAIACLPFLRNEAAGSLLEELGPEAASRLLRQLDAEQRDALLHALPAGSRSGFERLLRFPEGTAGAAMEPRTLALPEDVTVEEARGRLEREADRFHSYVYVVDRKGVLVGVAGIRDLLRAEPGTPLRSVAQPASARLSCYAETSELLSHPGWESFHALPVVDPDGTLLGVIRYATLRRLEREKQRGRTGQNLVLAGLALAEVYWITLANALAAANTLAIRSRTAGPRG